MRELGVAVLGCGGIAKLHRKLLAEMEGVAIRAVCDIREDRAREAASECGCAAYTDWREALKRQDIDVIHICTPHYLHADMAIEGLQSGRYVVCEKPMATEVADAVRMIEADRHGRLGIVFQNRYNLSSRKAKGMLEAEELGALQSLRGTVAWHREAAYYTESGWRGAWATEGGGVLINQSIHTLDLMLWMGGAIDCVTGAISTDALHGIIEVEDTAHFTMEYTDGKRGIFYATTANSYDAPIELELRCERGTLFLRGDTLLLRDADGERELLTAAAGHVGEKDYWGNSHGTFFADFYTHLREGKPFWLDGVEGLPALVALKSVYRSSAERRPVFTKEWGVRHA